MAYKGVFWCIAETETELTEDNILDFRIQCGLDGAPYPYEIMVDEIGLINNHKKIWGNIASRDKTHGKPFNYYPRGRVEIKNGKIVIWINHILIGLIPAIKSKFMLTNLGENNISVKVDGSAHYESHFDKGDI